MLLALTSTDEEGGDSTGAMLVEISMSNRSLTLWGQGVGHHLWAWVRATGTPLQGRMEAFQVRG